MKNTTKLFNVTFGILLTSSFFAQGNSGSNVGVNTNQGQGQGQGQGVTRWKLDGNTGTGNEFIGTTNQQDLILKSGNEVGLRITPGKDVKIPGQIYMDLHRPTDPGAENIVTVDYNGMVKSLEKSGLAAALYGGDVPLCFIDPNTGYPAPTWSSYGGTTGVIYTDFGCPANVGIGTSTPEAKLDVRGKTYLSSNVGIGIIPEYDSKLLISQPIASRNGVEIQHGGTGNNYEEGYGLIVNSSNGNGALFKSEDSNASIALQSSNTEVSEIKFLDQYGFHKGSIIHKIESANSTYTFTSYDYVNNVETELVKIADNGTFYSREIKVQTTTFPDYVFEEGYELMNLEELGNFIEKEGHLPNMPTEAEVLENGIAVGEMEVRLVEKIEELTLYIIELEKKYKELEQKINE